MLADLLCAVRLEIGDDFVGERGNGFLRFNTTGIAGRDRVEHHACAHAIGYRFCKTGFAYRITNLLPSCRKPTMINCGIHIFFCARVPDDSSQTCKRHGFSEVVFNS